MREDRQRIFRIFRLKGLQCGGRIRSACSPQATPSAPRRWVTQRRDSSLRVFLARLGKPRESRRPAATASAVCKITCLQLSLHPSAGKWCSHIRSQPPFFRAGKFMFPSTETRVPTHTNTLTFNIACTCPRLCARMVNSHFALTRTIATSAEQLVTCLYHPRGHTQIRTHCTSANARVHTCPAMRTHICSERDSNPLALASVCRV